MRWLVLIAVIGPVIWPLLASPALAGTQSSEQDASECQLEWWKRAILSRSSAYYRGQVEPGSASLVHVEVWSRGGDLIATAAAVPNPRGVFEALAVSSEPIKRGRRVIFSCATGPAPVVVLPKPQLLPVIVEAHRSRHHHLHRHPLPRHQPRGPVVKPPRSVMPSEGRRLIGTGVNHLGGGSGVHHLR